MVAIWVSPVTRTSVTVTKPSRGSLIRRSSISATITWIRSAILRTRGLVMFLPSQKSSRRSPPGYPGELRRLVDGSATRDLAHLEGLHDIPDLDVLVVLQHQTALEALADLGRVVLLPLQRGEVEVVRHDRTVAQQARLGVAPEQATGDHAAGDVADLRGAEDLADLRLAEDGLLVHRLEHALEGRLDLLDRLVDDRVVPDLDAFLVGHLRRLALGPDVEADDDGVGGGSQVDVGLRDRADTAVDDPEADLVADVDLGQGVLEGLDRTGHVALEDEVELLALALLHGGHEVLEGTTHATLGLHGRPLARLTLLGDLASHAVVLDHDEVLARTRHRAEAQHHRRTRRVGLLQLRTVLVEHGADSAVGRTGHDRVADAEGSALHQHRGDRTATAVQVRLDDETLGVLVGVGPQVQRRVGGEHDGLEQLVEVELGLGRDVDEHRVAAVLLGHQTVLGQLATDLGRVRLRLVDLVDRDHDRHTGRLGVVERLDRLRHHTVVRRDYQDGDVGGLRTTGTHGGEPLVTRGVDEGDPPLFAVDVGRDLVGTDVLGDATGLLVDDVRAAQRVEELGLSVVDVTHDGHDRRTHREVALVALVLTELEVEGLEQLAVLVLGRDDLHDVVELLAEQLERLVVDRLGRGHHLAQAEQHLDQGGRVDADLLGEVGQGRATGQLDDLAVALADAHTADRRGLHGLELLTTRPLRLATATRRTARATEGTLGLAARVAATGAATAATGTS